MTLLVIVSHYNCCHDRLSDLSSVLQHFRPSPEPATCPAEASSAPPSALVKPVEDNDPISMMYRFLVDDKQSPPELQHEDKAFVIHPR